jgi:hypothetical protein
LGRTNSETPRNSSASPLIVGPLAKREANTPARLCSLGVAPIAGAALKSEAAMEPLHLVESGCPHPHDVLLE